MTGKSKARKIALLSDVHGNLPALEAVLQDATQHGAGEVWNLGDFLGYAPFPNEVVQRLRDANAVSIIGNYDRKVLDFEQKQEQWKRRKAPEKFAAFRWNYEHLSADTKRYLRSLPEQTTVQAHGCTALLVHGSPDSLNECLGPGTPQSRFDELAESAGMDLIVCGHSHEAFVRRAKETWFINPGSVGRPEGGDWRASYALLELTGGGVEVGHRCVPYDVERVVRAIRAADLPESFVDVVCKGRSLDELQRSMREGKTSKTASARPGPVREAVLAFAKSCDYERGHTHQVTRLALELFDGMKSLHAMGDRERSWLEYGALLHDIGWLTGRQGHHKAALELIMAEPSLPFDLRERMLIGLIARYHRKALPSAEHKYYGELGEEDQHRVQVLAGILRIADGLDRTHADVVQHTACEISEDEITIICEMDGPADEETAAARKKAALLEQVFSRDCLIEVRRN